MSEVNWYVVHTYSGYENKVKANIEKTIENRHLEDQILEVRVPMEEVVEVKNGTKKQVLRKLFPGYVLINMIMNDDTWYVVRNTRGVTGFVGPGSKPVPLTDEEMVNLGITGGEEKVELDLEVGDAVVVTGGASGIGKAVVEELLSDGAKVSVCDMNPNAPTYENGEVLYIPTNVTSKESVDAMVAKTVETYGHLDGIVNNAGINIPRLLVDEGHQYELDEAVWDKVMNVNLKGVFLCAQAAARVLVAQRSGVILNMSSESGLEGSEGQSVYAASKNAVNSLTRSWAKELGKKGVRVVGAAPGILEATGLRTLSYETALAYTRGITIEELRAGYAKTSTTPMGRSGKLTEVANTVAFLLSDRASYVDGVTLNIAGGKTRG